MLIYCFNKYVQCQYKHEWQIKVKKLHIFHCFYMFCLVVFIRICVLHTALILFGCISPDMCIAYTLILSSLVVFIQVIQGFIHDDHEDLINKHVMMIRDGKVL
jgi:hypothetical protein